MDVYKVKTNLSMVTFEVFADTEDDALDTANAVLDTLVIREVEKV
jgi:hypothetical protein